MNFQEIDMFQYLRRGPCLPPARIVQCHPALGLDDLAFVVLRFTVAQEKKLLHILCASRCQAGVSIHISP